MVIFCVSPLTLVRYHMKYMFVGDETREIAERTIVNFHESFQNRLKFMTAAARREENQANQQAN